VDIIVFISVFSVVEMSICVKLYVVSVVILDLTMCWYILVHMHVDVSDADFERYMNSHCASLDFNDKQLASFLFFLDIIVLISVFSVVEMCKIARSFSSDSDALIYAYVDVTDTWMCVLIKTCYFEINSSSILQ